MGCIIKYIHIYYTSYISKCYTKIPNYLYKTIFSFFVNIRIAASSAVR